MVLQAVTRAFNQLQSKFQHFKAVDLARFEQVGLAGKGTRKAMGVSRHALLFGAHCSDGVALSRLFASADPLCSLLPPLAHPPQVRAMKEEELGDLLDQLLHAEHFISTFVAGLPADAQAAGSSGSNSSGGRNSSDVGLGAQGSSGEGTGSSLGLELVGRAVTVDPLAAAAAAAAFGPGQEPGEVVALPAGEAGDEAAGLIPAFHPAGKQDGHQGTQQAPNLAGAEQQEEQREEACRNAAIGGIEPLAWQELSVSADSGALSLLLVGSSSGGAGRAAKLRQLLTQVPAGADGRLSTDAVARSLGLQHQATVAALQRLFAGAGEAVERVHRLSPPSANLAASSQPQPTSAESAAAAGDADASSTDGTAGSAGAQEAFSLEQVEAGMARLLQLLASSSTSQAATCAGGKEERQPAHVGGPTITAAAAPVGPQPTSKHYWQSRAEAVLPPSVARAWALLERQATQQFAMLQGRTATADEVGRMADGIPSTWLQDHSGAFYRMLSSPEGIRASSF